MNEPIDRGTKGNVIHVDFRRGGDATVVRAPPEPRPPPEEPVVTRTFTRGEVADLFGITLQRLKSWERHEIVTPSARRGGVRLYDFRDLIAVRTARGLADAGLGVAQVRRAVEALRNALPDLDRPLADARVRADGQRVVARADGTTFDPITGQLVFDFDVSALREDVVRTLRPKLRDRAAEAYQCYLEGLRLDEEETTRERAEAAYRRAIELDPRLATAVTNLGNLRLLAGDRDEAEALYRKAMEADGDQAEAPYNLAYLLVEKGEREEAIELFERALRVRPTFAEAHFNLAMALEETGQRRRARTHWRRYLDLEPRGTWSEVAKRHLDASPRE